MDLQFFSFSGLYMTLMSVLLLMDIWLFFELLREKEFGGAKKTLVIALVIVLSALLLLWINLDFLFIIEISAFFLILIFLFFPRSFDKTVTDDFPLSRYDERDIMFSRRELQPGTERYNAYYSKNPDKEIKDIQFRKEPGLLSKDSLLFHKNAFKAAKSFFKEIELTLVKDIQGKNEEQSNLNIPSIINNIRKIAVDLGALDIGFTECKDYHFYSVKGRGDLYNKEINISHKNAIAFTVEMDSEMVAAAPKASIVMESAHQYLIAGRIAVAIAKYIRSQGYSAVAHIDGNYEVICPLVARDAGLGEIGRMGILMTPGQGPRVRIGVVTTDLELEPNAYKKDHSIIHFCNECKKCAECCPSGSIQMDAPKNWNGVKRWKIDSESCFTYWSKVGTDCGRCMAVCPYSHPNTLLHRLTRFGIKKSRAFADITLFMDDFFYGKKPKPKKLPTQKIMKIMKEENIK